MLDLLEHVIRNRDRVVSKDELLATVWNGRIVSDATLSSRINAARAVLDDNGDDQAAHPHGFAQRNPVCR